MASAVDSSASNTSPEARAPSISASQPVAHEAHVIASGARPAAASGQRELFTEATTTVLVSENGAVIHLAAAVVPGQLLFLINQDSRREVVAQVLRKRYFRPTNCYVELQFTEPAPGFWGLDFSATPDPAQPASKQLEAVERVRSARATDDNPRKPTPAPSAQEVKVLRQEIDLLRDQLKALMQTRPGAGNAAEAAASSFPPPVPEAVKKSPEELSPASLESLQSAPTKLSRLPLEPPDSFSLSPISGTDLAPKPQLTTRIASPSAKRSSKASGKSLDSSQSVLTRLIPLAAAFLLVTVAVAWYANLLPGISQPKLSVSHSPAVTVPGANSASPVPPLPSAQKTDPRADSPGGKQVSTASGGSPAATAEGEPSHITASPSTGKITPPSDLSTVESVAAAPKSFPPPEKKHASVVSIVKRSAVSSPNQAPPSIAALGEGHAIVPPKLLTSVQGIAPPEAVRGFVAGNVMLDAVVGPTGRVISTTVVSGRPSLRASATETVKQYRYQPAMQNGRPVSAHVLVTVQCWFEP
ncbi:MAG: hypothetical protein PVS2B2_15170 [Candidatus Acidiferrum sp.]